jgi:outer membrane cobalamin receptor
VEYKNVHSSGLETWINYGFTFGFLAIKGQFNYNFNRSVITATFEDHQQYEGNQLIYVPRNTFRASADAEFHDMFAGISCAYTGWRETTETADRDLRLAAFFIADCMVGYHRDEGRIPWGAYFRVDNLFNQSFQVIRSFPLPGRTYHISLTMGLTKKES